MALEVAVTWEREKLKRIELEQKKRDEAERLRLKEEKEQLELQLQLNKLKVSTESNASSTESSSEPSSETPSASYSSIVSDRKVANGVSSNHHSSDDNAILKPATFKPVDTSAFDPLSSVKYNKQYNLVKFNTINGGNSINPRDFEFDSSSPFDDAMLRAIDDKQELSSIFQNVFASTTTSPTTSTSVTNSNHNDVHKSKTDA